MARPIHLNDGRPTCLVPDCRAPRDLSCKYVLNDGTVRVSYRRWCSWHARNPHTSPNPAFIPVPEEAQCQVPGCQRRAREYRTTAEARHRPKGSARRPKESRKAQREWDAVYGPPHLLPGEHRYAQTCSIHTLRDLPGYVSVPLSPRPARLSKAAQYERRIESLAHGLWKEEYDDRGSSTRSLSLFRKLAKRMIDKEEEERG